MKPDEEEKEDSSYIYIYTLFFASLDNCFILSLSTPL